MENKRDLLRNRVVPLDLYRITPRTNCGECGYPTCLAFATQAVVGESALEACPHLDQGVLQALRERLKRQLGQGIGQKRESFEKTLEYLRAEVAPWLTPTNAAALGADFSLQRAVPGMRLPYLDDAVFVTAEDVVSLRGRALSPWEKIFLYNYVIGGAVEPSGRWVGMESLPNSVSKIKSLKAHCEEPLAKAFAHDRDALRLAASDIFQELQGGEGQADWIGECALLPKVRVRLLWWAAAAEEGFPARVKFLFDARVLETLDLESLLFACEQISERLLESHKRFGSPGIPAPTRSQGENE